MTTVCQGAERYTAIKANKGCTFAIDFQSPCIDLMFTCNRGTISGADPGYIIRAGG